MKTKAINIPALFFYGFLCGALAVVFMVSFQHFENFYQPEIIARAKYVQIPAKQKNLENLKPKSITFSYISPSAKEIRIEGDFNAWGAYPLILNKNENKTFTLSIALPTGKYKYRFLVDGKAQKDNSAPVVNLDLKDCPLPEISLKNVL